MRIITVICFLFLLTINSIKAQPYFTASVTEGCDSLKVKFSLTIPDTMTSIEWNFGNGETSILTDPDTVVYYPMINPVTHKIGPQTSFTVTVTLNGNTTFRDTRISMITVYRTVQANFICADTLTADAGINKICYVTDQNFDPTGNYSYNWTFEGLGNNTNARPLITYNDDIDSVQVSLTITESVHNCQSTFTSPLFLYPEVMIQNVFTPNGDQVNDYFEILSNGNIPLLIKIYSRTGILVHQIEGKTIRWDGKTAFGKEVSEGIYFYLLESLDADPGEIYNKSGFIYLCR